MKTIIATAAIALSLTAPSFAQVNDVAAFFAADNGSVAEQRVNKTSNGDGDRIELLNRANKESSAERIAPLGGTFATRADNASARAFFALTNDSPAENK